MQKSGKCQTIFFRIFSKYKKLILDNLHLIWYINHVAEIQQDATIAQVVERIIGNDEVTGPTPVSSFRNDLSIHITKRNNNSSLLESCCFFFMYIAFRDNRAARRGALRPTVEHPYRAQP